MNQKNCAECGASFEPRSGTQMYCSARCQGKDKRARNKIASIAEKETGAEVVRRESGDAAFDFAAYIIESCIAVHNTATRGAPGKESFAACRQHILDIDGMIVDLKRAMAASKHTTESSRAALLSALSSLRECAFFWSASALPQRGKAHKENNGLV